MFKVKSLIIGTIGSLALFGCTTNPITGRKSLQFIGSGQISNMAAQQYRQTLSAAKVVSNTAQAQSVNNVGVRIKNAAEKYYQNIGRGKDLQNYKWEFALIQDNTINAWCMPGGKVAVYTGIMPVAQTDNGLAVVMGHEVSHALAGHGNERISQGMLAQMGGALIGSTISNNQWAQIFNQVYPIGAQGVLLAYGRNQELEADKMGLYLMAMAAYDPREAIPFWQRMEEASAKMGKQNMPEFLSTHPGPQNRIAKLQANMNEALAYYKQANTSTDLNPRINKQSTQRNNSSGRSIKIRN